MQTLFVFLPDTLDIHQVGILKGFVRKSNLFLAFYVTNENRLEFESTGRNIGYCSETTPGPSVNHKPDGQWLHINSNTGSIRVGDDFGESNTICVKYDYSGFKNSDISTFQLQNYGEHFEALSKAIKDNGTAQHNCKSRNLLCRNLLCLLLVDILLVSLNFLLHMHAKCAVLLNYSTTIAYLNSNTRTLKWILTSLKEERKVSIRVGNALCSKLIDLVVGLCAFYYFVGHEDDFVHFVETSTESIIHGLEQLLNSLMGSPVGLKLNYAFNSALGNFFLYHIMLWRAFLQTTGPVFYRGMRWLSLPAMFGLTYQAALFSDLVAFATLHVYCIYVYAARLYGVQMKGLTSLWRLFIGRKYNPLRDRVDSHQYTHHHLFIGTLGFTVLLFLLPTTFLYYCVFTVLRLSLVVLDGMLVRLRYVLQCLPVYVMYLWFIKSPSVQGAISLEIEEDSDTTFLTLCASLQTVSLWQSMANSGPKMITKVPPVSWRLSLRDIATGALLITEKGEG